MYISKRLKELRTANNFSQEKLAELLNVSRQTISSWENERSYPDVHNLIMLCLLPTIYPYLNLFNFFERPYERRYRNNEKRVIK